MRKSGDNQPNRAAVDKISDPDDRQAVLHTYMYMYVVRAIIEI